MRTCRPFPLVPLVPFLVLAPLAAGQEAVTEERVRDAYEAARAAVEAALAFTPDAAIQLRFVEPEVVAERVAAENLPMVRLRQGDPARAEAEARELGAVYARMAFAKYAWSTREFLVVTDRWEEQAELLDRPELVSDTALRAVLVHELLHARDDATFGLASLFEHLDSNDAVAAMNALMEGHAQFQTRRVCERAGWTEGFEAFTQAIGALPESAAELDEATRTLMRILSATVSAAYHEGERFVAALHSAGGAEAVARAFREPPRDVETIFHPEWHLDPSTRPRILYDPEPALAAFAARFPEEEWSSQRVSLQPAQVEAALALLPPEKVKGVVNSLRAGRTITLQPSAAPGSKLVLFAVMEFESEAAARSYLEAARELGKLKAERMKKGVVRIEDSQHVDLEQPGVVGFLTRIHMKNGSLPLEVASLDAARGPIVVEAVFSAEPIEDGTLSALAGEMLDAVRRLEDEPAPR